jgi:3-oxoacyl-[acyl-carrier protein] reductase
MNVYDGKTAFITGATGGIGRAISEELLSQGCNVVLSGRNAIALKSVHEELQLYTEQTVEHIVGDLARDKDLNAIVENYSHKVDILINNAGVFPIKTIGTATTEEFDNCMAVNVRAPFILSREFANRMRKKAWGRIVNIGSSSAYYGNGKTGVYCTSKHALLGLSRSLYQEFRNAGVRVYNISPGSAQTSMGATDTAQDYTTFIRPSEIAEYVAFVCSYDGEMISEEIRLNRVMVR